MEKPVEITKEQPYVKTHSYYLPYDQGTINMLGGLIWTGYQHDPSHQLGAQIWNALSQLEYQNYIDYPLPETWHLVIQKLVPKPGQTKLHLLLPTNMFQFNELHAKLLSFKGPDNIDNLIQELLNQAVDPQVTHLSWQFEPRHQVKLDLQRNSDHYAMHERLEKPLKQKEG